MLKVGGEEKEEDPHLGRSRVALAPAQVLAGAEGGGEAGLLLLPP